MGYALAKREGRVVPLAVSEVNGSTAYRAIVIARKGLIVPVILGSMFVTILSNAMNPLEFGGYVHQILLGCVIIAAIFLGRIRQTRA